MVCLLLNAKLVVALLRILAGIKTKNKIMACMYDRITAKGYTCLKGECGRVEISSPPISKTDLYVAMLLLYQRSTQLYFVVSRPVISEILYAMYFQFTKEGHILPALELLNAVMSESSGGTMAPLTWCRNRRGVRAAIIQCEKFIRFIHEVALPIALCKCVWIPILPWTGFAMRMK